MPVNHTYFSRRNMIAITRTTTRRKPEATRNSRRPNRVVVAGGLFSEGGRGTKCRIEAFFAETKIFGNGTGMENSPT